MLRRPGFIVALIMTLIGFASFASIAQAGRTFYISSSSGSNSNAGTSTGAPWKSAPYMATGSGCSGGSGPSYAHQAGDKFVFKGGDTWPAACFDMIIPSGGNSSAQDYYGVCISNADFASEGLPAGAVNDSPCAAGTSWPSSGWTRPKFNLGGTQPGSTPIGVRLIYTNGTNDFAAGQPYITFDNFEISNWDTSLNSFSAQDDQIGMAFTLGGVTGEPGVGTIVENMYIHDWVTNENYVPCTPVGGCNYQPMAYTVMSGAYIARNNTISDANGYYFYNGTKTNSGTMGGCSGCTYFYGNKVDYGFAGCSSVYSCHDNEFSHMTGFGPSCGTAGTSHCYNDQDAIHSHVIYDGDGPNQTVLYVYNNLVHDNWTGITIGSLFYYTNVFNNVMWNNYHSGAIDMTTCQPGFTCPPNTSSQVGWVANNTIDQTAGDSSCFTWHATGGSGAGTLNFYNNICLGTMGGFSVATTNGTSTNHSMGSAEASTYGFTSANKYSPTSIDPNINATGTNLTSTLCSAISAACSDASGAPWFGASYIARQTSWGLGALVGGGASSSSSKPSPPTNLTASVQ